MSSPPSPRVHYTRSDVGLVHVCELERSRSDRSVGRESLRSRSPAPRRDCGTIGAMALSPTSQWTLVACGVMAHADGVLDGEECDRLLAMVEDEADGEEYSDWLAALGDAKRLDQLLEELPPAPAEDHREILENAWTLAIV